MGADGGDRGLDRAARAFERILCVLPTEFRQRHGPEMARLFRDLAEDAAKRRGPLGLWSVWLRSAADVLVRAPGEHLRTLTRGRSGRHAPGSKGERRNHSTSGTTRFGEGAGPMDTLRQDLRYGLRSLARRPGLTAVVAITLAVGIGATTAIFSVVNGVMLRKLPFPDSDRIVRLSGTHSGTPNRGATLAYLNFVDVRDRSDVFQSASAYDEWQPNLTGSGEPERLDAALVNTDFFDVLRVRPALGRFFRPEEDVDGQDAVVVLSYGLWQRKFGGDSTIIGRTLSLNGRPHVVVGVAPASFEDPGLSGRHFGTPALWRPLGLIGIPQDRLPSRGSSSYGAIARLKPGITLEAARAEVATISRRLRAEYPQANANVGMTMVPLRDAIIGDVRASLLLLLGAVAFVLAIVAANVGNLLLGRMSERREEMALRAALGATRGRMVRQLLTETLALAAMGGVLGLGLAAVLTRLVVALGGDFIPRSAGISVDLRVMAFGLLVTLGTGLACGVVPALLLRASELRGFLAEGGRGRAPGRRAQELRGALVACEVALALLLLTGAGLLMRSFWNALSEGAGVDPAHVLMFDVGPPFSTYRQPEQVTAFYDALLTNLRGLPGVRAAAAVNIAPLSGSFDGNPFFPAGRPLPAPGEEPTAEFRSVTPDYFRAMGIALHHGRRLEESDRKGAPAVVVIDETLARQFWPDADPVGQRLVLGDTTAEIVGVVADVKHLKLDDDAPPRVYVARDQGLLSWQMRYMTVVVRTVGDPLSLAPAARRTVHALDPNLPVANLTTMERTVFKAAAPPRFRSFLFGAFALVALLLATVGVYGVVSYSVSLRVREMAIRMALGARRDSVVRLILGRGLAPVAIGLAAGLAGALALSRLLRGLLYHVPPTDPAVLGGVAALMLGVAVVAELLPARRATRVDPMTILREE